MSNTFIKPTVGRKVWFRPSVNELRLSGMTVLKDAPLDATIIAVHSDDQVNLLVVDAIGRIYTRTSVHLAQEGEAVPDHSYAEWMPYQTGQAKKQSEPEMSELIKKLSGAGRDPLDVAVDTLIESLEKSGEDFGFTVREFGGTEYLASVLRVEGDMVEAIVNLASDMADNSDQVEQGFLGDVGAHLVAVEMVKEGSFASLSYPNINDTPFMIVGLNLNDPRGRDVMEAIKVAVGKAGGQ